jgi:hypothetical protein
MNMITKDQAIVAMTLASHFEGSLEMHDELAAFNEAVTQSGTYYALLEMAGTVMRIEAALPEDALVQMGPEVFYGWILHEFDYKNTNAGHVPALKTTVTETAKKIVEEFQLDAAPSMAR